jgi:hypothetical protein
VAYHVDYFNDPWIDPYSKPLFSEREAEYSRIYDRAHRKNNPGILYLTPLMIVDGTTPFVASNDDATERAALAIAEARKRPIELTIEADAVWESPAKLALTASARATRLGKSGREVLLSAALVENDLATAVKSGELAGKTYRAGFVAREFASQPVIVATPASEPKKTAISIPVPAGLRAEQSKLVVFAQDEKTGRVLQAVSIPLPNQSGSEPPKVR